MSYADLEYLLHKDVDHKQFMVMIDYTYDYPVKELEDFQEIINRAYVRGYRVMYILRRGVVYRERSVQRMLL